MSARYPLGMDYEWFASDNQGRIARFTTGGLGPIPSAIIDGEVLCKAAQSELAILPRRGEARVFVSIPKPDDFIRCAEAGFYTYDCDDLAPKRRSRSYKLVSAPTSPLHLDDLSSVARNAVCLATLADVDFGQTVEIGSDQIGEIVTVEGSAAS